MATLNAAAAEAMVEAGASACTDVTGFGLLGHLHIALRAAGASAVLDASAVPFLDGTHELGEAGMIPSGTRSNRAFVEEHVEWGELSDVERLMLADAQTSGGLLIAIAPSGAEGLDRALASHGAGAARIGRIQPGPAGAIAVRGRVR
jgi:selenide,water dikinase